MLRKELDEAWDYGLTRIEISYYADSLAAEPHYFSHDFQYKAAQDIDDCLLALNYLSGNCYQVPIQ